LKEPGTSGGAREDSGAREREGERERDARVKGSAGVKELKKQNISNPGRMDHNGVLCGRKRTITSHGHKRICVTEDKNTSRTMKSDPLFLLFF